MEEIKRGDRIRARIQQQIEMANAAQMFREESSKRMEALDKTFHALLREIMMKAQQIQNAASSKLPPDVLVSRQPVSLSSSDNDDDETDVVGEPKDPIRQDLCAGTSNSLERELFGSSPDGTLSQLNLQSTLAALDDDDDGDSSWQDSPPKEKAPPARDSFFDL